MTDSGSLGDYLRARRALVDPADLGLPTTGVRRTPGLRREEVATLAGISVDYYLRLEQGRDRNPSPQVIDALAGVFRLDAAATDYLLGLASGTPRRHRPRRQTVPPGVRYLIDAIDLPAFVENRRLDVLATNRLATALAPAIRVGENRVRSLFLDDTERRLHPDWEHVTAGLVAAFRAAIGADLEDPDVARLVGELSLASERFASLWARHDVRAPAGGAVRLDHPELGLLDLRREKLTVPDTDLIVVMYLAEPGSPSAQALALLGTLAAVEEGPVASHEGAREEALSERP